MSNLYSLTHREQQDLPETPPCMSPRITKLFLWFSNLVLCNSIKCVSKMNQQLGAQESACVVIIFNMEFFTCYHIKVPDLLVKSSRRQSTSKKLDFLWVLQYMTMLGNTFSWNFWNCMSRNLHLPWRLKFQILESAMYHLVSTWP